MQRPKLIDYKLPAWAMSYLINSDASGLTDEEKNKVDDFVRNEINSNGWPQFHVVCPDNESYFSWQNDIDGPLGADVYDCKVIVDFVKPGCKVNEIAIKAKRYKDGPNTYHNVKIWINGVKMVHLKGVYGYERQYIETAGRWLEENGFLEFEGRRPILWRYCEENGIEFEDYTNDNY